MTVSNQMKLLSLGMGALALTLVPISFAQGVDGVPTTGNGEGFHGKNHGGMHRGCHGQMYSQLGLSDQQKSQLKSAHEAFRKENASAFESIKAKHQQLREMRQAGKADSSEAQALRAQLKSEWQALAAKKEAMNRQILTPEQFQKMQTLRQQFKANHPQGIRGDKKQG